MGRRILVRLVFYFLNLVADGRWLSASEVSRLEAEALWVLNNKNEGEKYVSSLTSSLIALGLARHAPASAMQSLSRVLSFQRPSGLIPAFALTGDKNLPTFIQENGIELPSVRHFWNSSRPALAALPIHAAIALKIYEACPDRRQAGLWAVQTAPRLARYHQYLRRQRSIPNSHLLRLAHPWESSARRSDLINTTLNIDEEEGHLSTTAKLLTNVATGEKAEENLARCLLNAEDDSVADCVYVSLDVEFNAVFALSEAALNELCQALDRRKLPTPRTHSSMTANALSALWTKDGYRSRYSIIDNGMLDTVLEPNSSATAAVAILADLAPLLVSSLSRQKRDALVDQLLPEANSQYGFTTFACFGVAPFPDLSCQWDPSSQASIWRENAFTRPTNNLFLERGLRHSRQDALADWLRDATLYFIHQQTPAPISEPPPAQCWTTTATHEEKDDQKIALSDDTSTRHPSYSPQPEECTPPIFTQAFYPFYDHHGTGSGENRSVLTAAVVLALITPDATLNDYPDAPVSRSMLFALIAFELAVAFFVAVTCFTTNLLMIRTLRAGDTEIDTVFSELATSPTSSRRSNSQNDVASNRRRPTLPPLSKSEAANNNIDPENRDTTS